jgi:hypothetical protein
MKEELLRIGLEQEVDRWSGKTIDDLRARLAQPLCYVSKINDEAYRTEVQVLEDLPDYVHVVVAVDDLSFRKSMRPMTTSFLVHSDGRVER